MRAAPPLATPSDVDGLTALAAAVLADTAGAPPAELSRLVDGLPTLGSAPRRAASTVRRFTTGLGTSALRFPSPATGEVPALGGGATGRVLGGPTGLGTSGWRVGAGTAPSRDEDDSMPELFCPGALRDDPALGEEVNERLLEWAEEVGIYPGNLDRLRAANFGRLIMLTHPGTDDPDRLLAATKCVVAEWAADDYYVDEVELGADPRIVGSRLAKLHAVVDPAQLTAKYALQLDEYRRTEPIATAFRSAMEHLARYTSAAQMGRFQHQMSILYVAWNQEADWHSNGRVPPVWEYLVQRHLNSYLPPMILIDVVSGYVLSADEFYHPRVRRAITLAGDANVLINDLYSGASESDTDFNLPSVLVAEEGLTRREAIKRTVEIHNELMHEFVAEAAALGVAGSPALRRFLAETWAWMGGSREWHATTGRYHPASEGASE
jgi:2-methylisoborneol synthase